MSKILEAARKVVASYDETLAEIQRLEKMKTSHEAELDGIIHEAKIDDQTDISRATDLQIRLRMLPNKCLKLEEKAANICKVDALPLLTPLTNESGATRDELLRIIKRDLPPAVVKALRQFLPADGELVQRMAEQALDNSLPYGAVYNCDPLKSVNNRSDRDDTRFIHVKQLRDLIATCDRQQRLREIFFKGNSLNLDAVAKIESLDLLKA